MKITEEELRGRWVNLSERAVIRLTGSDRVRYLNGQVTNDVTKVDGNHSVPACLCNAKGKVEALIWISKDGDSLLIDGELSQRDQIMERLDRYLIADDCELSDETGNLTLIHHFQEPADGAATRRIASTGCDVWLETPDVPFKPENEIKRDEWNMLGLRSSLPLAGQEITGSEFPAELRIDEWAVDFQKGCYLGQEVISRIKSVGRVKRQLCLIFAEHSFTQDSTLRNDKGEEFTATRDSEKISAGYHLAIAWGKAVRDELQQIGFQRVG